jgi:hypothetical protein
MKKGVVFAVLGVWLIISPYILGGPLTVLAYSNALAGAGLILYSVWQIFGKK